jgi:thioredoxin 1
MSGSNVIHVTADNWDSEVIKSDIPVLVDFWAEWCGPCRAIGPTIEALAEDYAGRVKMVKVNVDDNQALAGEFGIRSIPTLLILKDGAVQAQMVGALSKQALEEKLQASL